MRVPLITEIQRFSLQDGPGIRTTLFVKGCPLHCPWCHNPENQNCCPELYYHADRCTHCLNCVTVCPGGASTAANNNDGSPAMALNRNNCQVCLQCMDACFSGARESVGQSLSPTEILRELMADKPFFDTSGGGVTLSGGEPLMFPDFTGYLSTTLKKEGIHVAVETSACVAPAGLERVAASADMFIVDLKTMNSERHERIVGGPLQRVLDNIERLMGHSAALRIHIPLIPGFNDTVDDFQTFASYLGPRAKSLNGVDVLPYHAYGVSKYNALGRAADPRYNPEEDVNPKAIKALVRHLKTVGVGNLTVGGMVGVGKKTGASG